jgi:hypothetical protein
LLTGPKTFSSLSPTPAIIAEVAFVVAGVLALLATALALRTSQRTRFGFFGDDPQGYQARAIREVIRGSRHLQLSQGLAASAAAFSLIAAGFLFFGSKATSPLTTIQVNGTTLCKGLEPSSTKASTGVTYFLECSR